MEPTSEPASTTRQLGFSDTNRRASSVERSFQFLDRQAHEISASRVAAARDLTSIDEAPRDPDSELPRRKATEGRVTNRRSARPAGQPAASVGVRQARSCRSFVKPESVHARGSGDAGGPVFSPWSGRRHECAAFPEKQTPERASSTTKMPQRRDALFDIEGPDTRAIRDPGVQTQLQSPKSANRDMPSTRSAE